MNVLQNCSNESAGFDLVPEDSSWFAVQTRPRFERKVVAGLQEKGIKAFLPLYSATHQWSDRRRIVHTPLFPGYAFVRVACTQNDRVSVLRTNGVIAFVGARSTGTPIPASEIDAVQKLLDHRVPVEPFPYLSVGQRVCIRGGSLDGITGFLTAINSDASLVISVELIQDLSRCELRAIA